MRRLGQLALKAFIKTMLNTMIFGTGQKQTLT